MRFIVIRIYVTRFKHLKTVILKKKRVPIIFFYSNVWSRHKLRVEYFKGHDHFSEAFAVNFKKTSMR